MAKLSLDNIGVATPCPASWDEMRGDAQVRHCDSCQLQVYNISALTRQEAEKLLTAHTDQHLCVRLCRRADGTILTQDCPTGLRAVRSRVAQRAGVALTAILALFGGAFGRDGRNIARPGHNTLATNLNVVQGDAVFSTWTLERRQVATTNLGASILEGVIADSSGGMIANASLKLTQESTNQIWEAMTDGAGKFHFQNLPDGIYTFLTQVNGFQDFKRMGLVVGKGEVISAKITLAVRPSEVGTTVTSLGGDINYKQIHDLPLNTREVYFMGDGINVSDLTRKKRPQTKLAQWQVERSKSKAETSTQALLEGRLLNPYNGIIPGLTLELRHDKSKQKWYAATDALGIFRFMDLPAGEYTIELKAVAGFQGFRQKKVKIEAGESLNATVVLLPSNW